MSRKKIIDNLALIALFSLLSTVVFSEEYSLEDLNEFKNSGLITAEDYNLLKAELLGENKDGEALFTLSLNDKINNPGYSLRRKDDKLYFSLLDFFKTIEFNNYSIKNEKLIMKLGKSLEEITVDMKSKRVFIGRTNKSYKITDENIFTENSDFFIESSLFKEMFLLNLDVNENKLLIKGDLNFNPPFEIDHYLNRSRERLLEENSRNRILYTNDSSLFDVGYLKTRFNTEFSKSSGEKSFDSSWNGSLEYRGNLLYGEFNTSYDVKNDELGDTYIYYPDIWKNHSLEFGSYGTVSRELGLSFKKEKGYFIENDVITIKESVPLGSKVELLYMGFPLDVMNEENGFVEFTNREIKRDRDYVLRVHTDDGRIYDIAVNTARDFNLQNAGQVEYNLDIREEHDSENYNFAGNIYYGITDNLTVGLGAKKVTEYDVYDRKQSVVASMGELVYSNTIFKNPYTIALGGEYVEENRYSHNLQTKFDIYNFSFYNAYYTYGDYYNESRSAEYSVKYTPFSGYSFDYNYRVNEYHEEDTDIDYDYGISIYKSLMKDLLLTADVRKGRDLKHEYSIYLNYTGFHNFNTSLQNLWTNDGRDYNTTLSFTNKNFWETVDFSLDLSYSNRSENSISVRFTIDYDNFINFGFSKEKGGAESYNLGVNRIIDLKNVTANIESMDSSRVEIITFVDSNDNYKYDEGEELVENVAVEIGSQKVVTDEEGRASMFGVPNGILYELKPRIKKPSYSMGNNVILIKGKNTGTITAHIPITPLTNLEGFINLDDFEDLSEELRNEILENVVIKVTHKERKLEELTMPDEMGYFEISGLFPDGYNVEVMYLGDDFDIPNLSEQIKLGYVENNPQKFVFNVTKNKIALAKKKKEKI